MLDQSHDKNLLTISQLRAGFDSQQGFILAVDNLSISIPYGKIFALLGESGCGKSMTALSIMQLLPMGARIAKESKVILNDQDLLNLSEVTMRKIRGREIGMIFQEPMVALNPVFTVGEQIGEVLRWHFNLSGKAKNARILELLNLVGIPDPRKRIDEYPHQLSGGMKQRVMIAMALAGEPKLLIADEPTTALDVTIQQQVLELLRTLQKQNNMAILLITHDLGVVAEMADEIAIMYAGQIVEQTSCTDFFAQPLHPYSQKLLAALPAITKRDQALAVIPGAVPIWNKNFLPCRFANRCDFAQEPCRTITPRELVIDTYSKQLDFRRGARESELRSVSVIHEQANRACNKAENSSAKSMQHKVQCHLYDPTLNLNKDPTSIAQQQISIDAERSDAASVNLSISDLKVYFPIQKGFFKRIVGYVKAVDDVNLVLKTGTTLALVGESGCGKTTIGKSVLQLIPITEGIVKLNEAVLNHGDKIAARKMRQDMQIIFQDPYSSMNPRMMVADIIAEGLKSLHKLSDAECDKRVDELLQQVGLSAESKYRYPHEFSGGQRQRICIARALAVAPKILICDEPTSALDVSVQAQILNLLQQLQRDLGLAYLFITHNIAVVAYLADEIAVMYLGRIVEYGAAEKILTQPKHPYTQALLSAVPVLDAVTKREVIKLHGEIPSPINPPSGCYFHPRCKNAMPQCRESYPPMKQLSDDQATSCFLYEE